MIDNRIDLPVALVFFNRPDTLEKVFEEVQKIKPSQLFLIQDGAREGNSRDIENIQKCRSVVENINWKCEVHKIYSERNLGCGMNIYSGIKKAFETVDRLVILEDDIVVSGSFFYFCKELLEKFKDDKRIIGITGMNHKGVQSNCPYSYFYSRIGSCWGWATWKRCWEDMEFDSQFLEDNYAVKCFLDSPYRTRPQRKEIIRSSINKRQQLLKGEKLSGWAHQFMTTQFMTSGMWIVPQKNLISNIGLTDESTHAASSLKRIPKGLQSVFFAKRYDVHVPLKHPRYMIEDTEYANDVLNILGEGILRRLYRKIETIIRFCVFADFKEKKTRLLKKIK